MFHSVCHCYMCTWAITPVFTRRFKIKIKEDVVISILVLPLNFFTFFIFWKLPIVFSFVESFFFIMTFLVISVNYNGTHYERSMYLVSTKLLHVIIIMSEDDMFPFTCIRNVSILHRVEQECLITRKKFSFEFNNQHPQHRCAIGNRKFIFTEVLMYETKKLCLYTLD